MASDPNAYDAPPPPPVEPSGVLSPEEKDARMWAMFCHLAGLAMFTSIPGANVLGPLIVWQIKKNDYAFVDDQGKEATNFQISCLLYTLIAVALAIASCGVLIPLPLAVLVFDVVFLVLAGIKANNGEYYRYPLTIRLLK